MVALLTALLMALPAWNSPAAGSLGGLQAPAADFSTNVRVSHGSGNAWSPTVAADSGGKIHVAWSDDRNGYRRIYYSNSTNAGTTWATDWEIDGSAGTASAYEPAIAVDRTGGPYDGSVYVAWRELVSDFDIYLRRSPDRGATWLPRIRVDAAPAGVASLYPAITVDRTGAVWVAWSDTRTSSLQVFVRRSTDGGASWSTETQVSQTATNNVFPTIAASATFAFVAWKELDPVSLASSLWVARSSDGGATWSNLIVDTGPTPTNREAPQLFAAPDGTVLLTWIGYDTSSAPAIRASRSTDAGGTWSPATRLDDATRTPLTYQTPRLASATGDLFAVWSDTRNGDPDILYTSSGDSGATWGDGVANNDPRVDDTDSNVNPFDDATNQTYPNVASDGFGVYVAWCDDRATPGRTALYFSRFSFQRIQVSEFQDAPQGSEAVEVAAFGSMPISFAGYRLDIDGFSLDLSGFGTVSPGQHKVVGDPASADVSYDITLGDEGGIIRLFDGAGALLDTVAYGQRGTVPDPIAGESVSRYWTGEKYSDDWARTPAPSWDALNTVPASDPAPTVVLNEVLFNPSVPSDAFIELFYAGVAPLSLVGYTIAGDAAFPIPSATVSASDPYHILRYADAPALFGAMDAAGDNVYLYNASGGFLDEAGWSSAHAPGTSMARVPEGLGDHDGFDDPTSTAAGWLFDQTPTIPLVILRQDQTLDGDLGQLVAYSLTVLHKQSVPDIIELSVTPGPAGWAVTLRDSVTGVPLQDHDGDSVPDTDLLAPGSVFAFNAWIEIPPTPPVPDSETVVVAAQARLTPLARSTVVLTTWTFPRIEPTGSVDADPIFVLGSPPNFNMETNLTLTISGRGSARVRRAPQDTVLLLDRSGSLADPFCPGCFALLKEAAKTYVDNLTVPDTGAVIYYNDRVIAKGPLTTNYARIKADIDSENAAAGGTQIGEAIRAANNELGARGIPFHFWAIILFTDGNDNPGGLDPLNEARTSAGMGIRIFTIGLGSDVNENLLRNIATATGGEYLHADTPQDLIGIYAKIGSLIDNLAGFDSDLTDDVPMVEVTLPPYIVVTTKPFVDPVSGGPRPPAWRGTRPTGTVLQWNVSALRVKESWSVRFTIQSSQLGVVDTIRIPASRTMYSRWDGVVTTLPFPAIPLTVVRVSVPVVRYTITRSPEVGTVQVDGFPYAVPAGFDWFVGDSHTIGAPTEDPFATDSRYLLNGWDDGGAATHTITAGPVNATITARYFVQHRPTVRLVGTNAAHDVLVATTAAGVAVSVRASGTWSDWVDEGTPLAIDRLAAGSGPDERWVTEEDFAVPPWTAVTAPFARSVLYYHQYSLRVDTAGLSPARPAPLSSTAFGRSTSDPVSAAWAGWIDEATDAGIADLVSVSGVERYRTRDNVHWKGDSPHSANVRYYHQWLWRVTIVGLDTPTHVTVAGTALGRSLRAPGAAPWSDWVDDGTPLAVDDKYMAGPRERYRAQDTASWTVTSAMNVTVRYVREMQPHVLLIGTDDGHTVGVLVRTPGGDRRIAGLYAEWSDWIEVGATLVFDTETTGGLPRRTRDNTTFEVRTPFDASILYAAPSEVNLKPFFSAVYVAVLVAIGVAFAWCWPLAFAGSRRTKRELRPEETRARVARDRRKTVLLVVAPVATLEAAIGIASYFTGVFRIPEEGSWISIGLLVNTVILAAGLGGEAVARARGYDAAKELKKANMKWTPRDARAIPPPPPPTSTASVVLPPPPPPEEHDDEPRGAGDEH